MRPFLTPRAQSIVVAWTAGPAAQRQPEIAARGKPTLTIEGLRFKDANGSGALDPYEDWRLPAEARVRDRSDACRPTRRPG